MLRNKVKHLKLIIAFLAYIPLFIIADEINELEINFINKSSMILLTTLKNEMENNEIKLSKKEKLEYIAESENLIKKCIGGALDTFIDDDFKEYFLKVIVTSNQLENIPEIFHDEVTKYYLDFGLEREMAEEISKSYMIRLSPIPIGCRHESNKIREKYYKTQNR